MPIKKPEGRQREVLDLDEIGHYVVLGTAGSGKTTLAILRAAYLSQLGNLNGQRVLLVTFNKALVTYLNYMSDGLLQNVDVLNYHRFARGYLAYKGLLGRNDIVSTKRKKINIIKDAIAEVVRETGINPTLQRAPEVFYEEINWIQRMGITTLNEYVDAERIGRGGTRITRDNREYFFSVYRKHLELRGKQGYLYDWDDIAYYVNEGLKEDDTPRMYKHIIIDEGQDFSPVMLKSLVNAIPQDGSITFFGDVAQQIYGGRLSWRNAGFRVKADNIWRFEQNYRNSKEIAELAIAISKQPFFKDNADMVMPKYVVASGPLPALVEFNDESAELGWVIRNAEAIAKTQTVAILARDRDAVNTVKLILDARRVSYQELHGDMNHWNHEPGISVGTYHSSKGLEFDAVLIPLCNSDRLPAEETVISLEDMNEALGEEAKLIYVAVTRARRGLVISYTGEPSEIIPAGSTLYRKTAMP